MPEFFLPRSLDEATGLMAEHGDSLTVMAGGTNVLRFLPPGADGPVMGLSQVGLDDVSPANGGWRLGAAVTMARLRQAVTQPALQAAAGQVGGPAIQNTATIGGNLHARQPYGDVAAALLALDAELTFASTGGEQTKSLAAFYDEWKNGAPPSGALLTGISVPAAKGDVTFIKHGRRAFNSPTVVSVAARVVKDGGTVSEARIALSGVGPHPMRCAPAEEAIVGAALDEATIARAGEAAEASVSPATDAVATEWYRRRMTAVFVRRALERLT